LMYRPSACGTPISSTWMLNWDAQGSDDDNNQGKDKTGHKSKKHVIVSDSEDSDPNSKKKAHKAKKAKHVSDLDEDECKPVHKPVQKFTFSTKKSKTTHNKKDSSDSESQDDKSQDDKSQDDKMQLVPSKYKIKASLSKDDYPVSARSAAKEHDKLRKHVNTSFFTVGTHLATMGETLGKLCKSMGLSSGIPDLKGKEGVFALPPTKNQVALPAPPAYTPKTQEGQDEFDKEMDKLTKKDVLDGYAQYAAGLKAEKKDEEVLAQKAARKAKKMAKNALLNIQSFDATLNASTVLDWAKMHKVVAPNARKIPKPFMDIFKDNNDVFGLVCFMNEKGLNPFVKPTQVDMLDFDGHKDSLGLPTGVTWDGTLP